jgi:hypothetical protein
VLLVWASAPYTYEHLRVQRALHLQGSRRHLRQCSNLQCSCHTTTPTDWERDLRIDANTLRKTISVKRLRDVIETTRKEAYEAGAEDEKEHSRGSDENTDRDL